MTGGMVVAMPLFMGLMVELISPGFLALDARRARPPSSCSPSPARLQVAGFVAIRRLGAVRS